ncbi:tetratricopeptide repeat protein [Pelagicoccus enzymogenes]|uniref:tetratricopeptide repeat protein n=1 Tax=Pelagicoccus enzymogenes TaxID=2773457 RepID=UPI00280ED723|nr:tetratricopeptide repeat protein [Pelagicoccus enzymogenes]MDQ8197368.1 tetratricopeptide repeat protein [Pelagicoccus enzymogenes]
MNTPFPKVIFLLCVGLFGLTNRPGIASAQDQASVQAQLQRELQALEAEGTELARLRSIARLYESLGELSNASSFAEQVCSHKGSDAEDIANLARIYVKDAKGETALDLLKNAGQRFPDSATLLYAQGMVYLAMDKAPAATYSLQLAAKLDPDDPRINYKLAELFFRRGNLERAETLLEPIVESEAAFDDAVLLYGQVLFASERERQGLRVIERYLKKHAESDKARGALVALLLKQAMTEAEAGRISRAVGLLEDADEVVPAEPKILMGLALLENEQGNATASIAYCKEIIDTSPRDLEAYAFLGRLQRVEGLAEEAEETFKAGLALAEELGETQHVANFNRLLNPFE